MVLNVFVLYDKNPNMLNFPFTLFSGYSIQWKTVCYSYYLQYDNKLSNVQADISSLWIFVYNWIDTLHIIITLERQNTNHILYIQYINIVSIWYLLQMQANIYYRIPCLLQVEVKGNKLLDRCLVNLYILNIFCVNLPPSFDYCLVHKRKYIIYEIQWNIDIS